VSDVAGQFIELEFAGRTTTADSNGIYMEVDVA
jgi:hypothetical protein